MLEKTANGEIGCTLCEQTAVRSCPECETTLCAAHYEQCRCFEKAEH